MRQIILLIAVVALVGCGKKTTPSEPGDNAEPQAAGKKPIPAEPTPAEKAAATKKAADEAQANAFVNTLGMKFVPVPGTEVSFCIWETRVRDYAAYAAANSGVDDYWKTPFSTTETSPVSRISWEDANAFCAWLTQKERVEGKITVNQRYRLPTDAEWSVAVGLGQELGNTPEEKSNGVKGVYPWGNAWPSPKGAGNYHGSLKVDSYVYTSPVGSFAANKFGLHDLGGNMWEWCEDRYNPADQQYRVMRGGCWDLDNHGDLLSSSRIRRIRGLRGHVFGFRCVLASD